MKLNKLSYKFLYFLIIAIFSQVSLLKNVHANNLDYMHGTAMHGDLKYPKDFKKFDYANENAFKGGKINRFSIGTFDNLNPYILKGVPAYQAGYLFETLMKSSFDEPFSQYGLIAEGVKVPPDRSWVAFKIRKEAKFSDGTKISPEDVKFSFETIVSKYSMASSPLPELSWTPPGSPDLRTLSLSFFAQWRERSFAALLDRNKMNK